MSLYIIEASLKKFEYWIRWKSKAYKTMGSCLRAYEDIKKIHGENSKWKFRPAHHYRKENLC